MNRRDERAIRNEADDLAAELEATLDGRLIERRRGLGDVPEWEWVNVLAHSDWERLSRLAAGGDPSSRSVWDGAIMFLAGEMLTTAGSPAGLLRLQRVRLIPLELEMLSGLHPSPTPVALVGLVCRELNRERARNAHPSNHHPLAG